MPALGLHAQGGRLDFWANGRPWQAEGHRVAHIQDNSTGMQGLYASVGAAVRPLELGLSALLATTRAYVRYRWAAALCGVPWRSLHLMRLHHL